MWQKAITSDRINWQNEDSDSELPDSKDLKYNSYAHLVPKIQTMIIEIHYRGWLGKDSETMRVHRVKRGVLAGGNRESLVGTLIFELVHLWRHGDGQWHKKEQLYSNSANGKETTCQCRRQKRYRFNPWVGKVPWRRAWQSTPVSSPGESHGHRSLAGCSP